MYPERHLVRLAAYSALGLALWSRRRWLLGLLGLAAAVHAAPAVRRTWRRTPGRAARVAGVGGVALTLAFIDVAKMWGYLRGLARPAADRFRGID